MNKKKWTAEVVQKHLDGILEDACNDEVEYLNMALVRQGLYKQIWPHWKKIFAGHAEIKEVMMRIDSIFETKLYHAGLHKKVSSSMAIFGLKNNHQWSGDKYEPSEIEELPAAAPEGKPTDLHTLIILANNEVILGFYDRKYSGIYRKLTDEDRALPLPKNTQDGQ